MKNRIRIFVGVIMLTLTSCQFTEKIYINEDGSGTFDLEIDLSEMMESMNGLKEMDSIGTEPAIVKDSIINFADILEEKKDSISKLPKEERKKLERLKNMKIKIHEDNSNGEMIMDYLIEFKDLDELEDLQHTINTAQSMEKENKKSIPSKTEMRFSFKDNKFKRIVIDKELTEVEEEKYEESLKQSAMFFEGSSYNIEYHFPRAIKTTTAKDATFSIDKKVLYIKKGFKEVTENPHILDFEVILE